MADKKVSNPSTRTKAPASVDDTLFNDVKDRAEQMKSDDGARNSMFDEIDEMYLMTWSGGSGKKWTTADVKVSPDARNAALGAVRLLVATDPIFNIEHTSDEQIKQNQTDALENAIGRMYNAAGRAAGNPIHYDALLSAILYSEMHLAVTSTASLYEAAKANGKGVARAERMQYITPFLVDVWNPKDGHAEFDKLGLSAYYREADTTVGKIKSDFGETSLPETLQGKKASDIVALKTFYDLDNTTIWTDEGVILQAPHNLPFIPVVVQYTEGSSLWTKPEEARQPLLYTLLKSGMWSMQNLIYSVMFTLIRDMGVTPLYVHKLPPGQEGKQLEIDFDEYPGVVHLVANEEFAPIQNKGLIDPAIQQGLSIATAKGQESTIYPQTLGAPVEGDSTFSELSLLSQSGRLPLIGTQRRGGWGLSQLMEMCMAMYKLDGTKSKVPGIDLSPSDIPDYVQIDTQLDVKLPQDKLQQANIASILTGGENPVVSNEWARKNVLNIGQSGDMDRQIWTERAANQMFTQFLDQQIQQAQQQAQMKQMGGQMPGQNQGQPTGQQPMNAGAMMPEGQGQMVQGGLPPQMAGMMPGAGQGSVPQEGMG